MNSIFRKVLGTTATLALLAGPALAQPYQGGPGGGGQMAPQHQQQGGPQGRPNDQGGPNNRPGGPNSGPQHYSGGPGGPGYGHPPHSNGWRQGDHYNGSRVVVNDWHSRGLRQPPPGYEWVNSGGQFILIALTTGLIASIIANSGPAY
jgi:Ni/Co efflux regulator RcnB